MQEAQAIVERIRRIAPTIQRLDLAVDVAHRAVIAGQLFLARATDTFDPYLREPWVPVDKSETHIVVEQVIPRGVSRYTPGQIVSLIGPVGKALTFSDAVRALLIVACEATPAALLMAASTMLARGGAVTLALVGRARHYPLEALPAEVEVVRAETYELWGEKDKMLGWADHVLVVAPPSLENDAYARLLEDIRRVRIEPAAGFVQGLFHGAMPCGVGACQACVVRLHGGEERPACIEGPAFDLLDVSFSAER